MRYRTGPVGGTLVFTVLALLGISGEITAGFRGQSVGSSIFGLVVIAIFIGFAAVGLNELRGVRTERRPDGTAVLMFPRLLPGARWWRSFPSADVASVSLTPVGRRSRLYNLAVTLRDGTSVTCGAVAVDPPRRVRVTETRASAMVEQIRHDLGLGDT